MYFKILFASIAQKESEGCKDMWEGQVLKIQLVGETGVKICVHF